MITRLRLLLALALVAAVPPACGTTTSTPPSILDLDRPIDVSFGCYGTVRMTGGGRRGLATDATPTTAVPIADCDGFAAASATSPPDAALIPLGQEDLTKDPAPNTGTAVAVSYYAFILQSVTGNVAIAKWTPKLPTAMLASDVLLQDIDSLQPGPSGISVGDRPVGIVTDRSGCFGVTANAGSCDLSTLDITSALGGQLDPAVRRVDVTNGAGAPMLARPSAIVTSPTDGVIGVACPQAPQGIVYVAYPDCHRVAAIDAATGVIQSSILFAADGSATIDPDPNFTCPAQCGAGGAITAGTRPITLDLVVDPRVDASKPAVTRRLAIGADNSTVVNVVDLDANFLPTGTPKGIALENAIGVTDVALSPQIGMGGDRGDVSDDPGTSAGFGGAQGGQFQFVYAVAKDGTVHVADFLTVNKECDTEIDPRYLVDQTDVTFLSCMPVGDPRLPTRPTGLPAPNDKVVARRAGAPGPGIQLLGDTRPLAVTIVHSVPATVSGVPPGPPIWMGYFAMVTSTAGPTYVVNIDDDNYPDTDDPTTPISRWLALALPHQLRDRVNNRSDLAEEPDPNDATKSVLICNTPGKSPDVNDATLLFDGPRLFPTDPTPNHPIAQAISLARIASDKTFELPGLRQTLCTGADTTMPVPALFFSASVAERKKAFPDLRAIPVDQLWFLTWEGVLSNDATNEIIDGPIVRIGQAIVDGTGMRVVEDTKPYCAMGVEPYDEVIMRGCDPTRIGECGIGNTCYVHPESKTGVGSCLPADQVDALSDPCRDYLISQRRYAVTSAKSGELKLMGRRHVLRTTPIHGCTSNDQCSQLEDFQYRLAHDKDPIADKAALDPLAEPMHTWSCESDPSRPDLSDPTKPGPNQCVMTCTDDAGCDDGTLCEAGRCVEGVVPPLQCVTTLQRYEVHADRAFTVIGARSGYQHSIVADPATGACVKDTNPKTANPLLIGRIPLIAPPCLADGLADLEPNPCETVVKHSEYEPVYTDSICTKAATPLQIVTRDATAIRFRNPQMTFELIDPTYPGDLNCLGDRGGGLTDIPTTFPGYAMQMRIVSGFLPYLLPLSGTVYPINVIRGPQESVWIADEGDFLSATSISTSGRVYRMESVAPFVVNQIQ